MRRNCKCGSCSKSAGTAPANTREDFPVPDAPAMIKKRSLPRSMSACRSVRIFALPSHAHRRSGGARLKRQQAAEGAETTGRVSSPSSCRAYNCTLAQSSWRRPLAESVSSRARRRRAAKAKLLKTPGRTGSRCKVLGQRDGAGDRQGKAGGEDRLEAAAMQRLSQAAQ